MRTPAGSECRYYYEDYYRGRETQECRLLARNPHAGRWRPALCRHCPVPGILQANACPDMVLEARVESRFLRGDRVVVEAYCTRTWEVVPEPKVGCGRCHLPREEPG